MEISLAASLDEVNSMWVLLSNLGFSFEEAITPAGTQRMPTKTYVDALGNFVCKINVFVHDTLDKELIYHVFTESHSVDSATKHVVADGNTHQINFLNSANMRTYILFTDSILARAGIKGLEK